MKWNVSAAFFQREKHNLLTLAYMLAAAGKSLPLTRADLVSNFVNIVAW